MSISNIKTEYLKKVVNKYPLVETLLKPLLILRNFSLEVRNSWQKEIVRNLEEVLVSDPIIRVKEFNGVFEESSKSDLFARILINKSYEKKIVQLCKQYIDPNKDVIDVGANVGFYTVFFAKNMTDRKVLAIEPTENAIKHLRRNIELNNVGDNVDIFEGVVSNKFGLVKIKTIEGKEEYSSIGKMKHPSVKKEKWHEKEVKSITLDNLIKNSSIEPGFLKVDVEGAEHLVFAGAENILSNNRPVILSELSDFLLRENGSSAEEVVRLIEKHNYNVLNAKDPSFPIEGATEIICFPTSK